MYVFEDRKEAGRLLAENLIKYKGSDSIVFGIPSGGVPIASEIANALNLPMDLIIVRMIQIPYNPEAGFGAMGPDGGIILNEILLDQLRLTEDEIKTQIKKTMDVIKKRNQLFRVEKPFPSLKGKIAIIVDDGLASGFTMLAAIKFIKTKAPRKIVVAVPTASKKTIDFILPEIDELICLNVRRRFPFAVADAYRNWYDLTDEEVLDTIKKSRCFTEA
ncbi:MAG: phosphoribosyltransferase family protein [Nitrospirota bacterium]|nr:phosphoribosyltransferase family protein [Nitrospirota bacterium]